MTQFSADIAIIGAGMAGASLAAAIGTSAKIVLIEAEDRPGYHATGRSAAFWSETYGGRHIQPLTTASFTFLEQLGVLSPRGAITIARDGDEALLDQFLSQFAGSGVTLEPIGRSELERLFPNLQQGWNSGVREQSTCDIDVASLHAQYLAHARRNDAELLLNERVSAMDYDGQAWRVSMPHHEVRAPIVVNAAGAWASQIGNMAGALPINILPLRRTVVQALIEPSASPDMPLVIDAASSIYAKPISGGRIWLSPHDETAAEAGDAAPEEIDVALAIDRLEQLMAWRIKRIEHKWAGLRSFAPDRLPVFGFDPRSPGFFWFAGQGGFGIQTAPAAALIAASQLLKTDPHPAVASIDSRPYLAARFLTF